MTKNDQTLRDDRGRVIRAGFDHRVRIAYPEDHRLFGIKYSGYVEEIKQDDRHGVVLILTDKHTGYRRAVSAKYARRVYDRGARAKKARAKYEQER